MQDKQYERELSAASNKPAGINDRNEERLKQDGIS
jgi:hypothetical protein